jgi:hypothetical protein
VRYALLIVLAFLVAAPTVASAAPAKIPRLFSSCSEFNKRYPHGVGRFGAHDKTAGVPVTDFVHSTWLYEVATSYNRGLDRDHDGIACELH